MDFRLKVEYTEDLLKQPTSKRVVKLRAFGFAKAYGSSDVIQPYRESRTGQWLGVDNWTVEERRNKPYLPQIAYNDGIRDIPASEFVLTDGVTFDLDNEEQLYQWRWIQYSPLIGLTEEDCLKSNECKYYIDQTDTLAKKQLIAKKGIKELYKFHDNIKKLSEKRWYIGYLLQTNLKNETEDSMDMLFYNAIDNPALKEKMIKDIDKPEFKFRASIYYLKLNGFISYNQADGIYYKTSDGTMLGSESTLVDLLRTKEPKEENMKGIRNFLLNSLGE